MEVLYYHIRLLLHSYATDACWILQTNGNKTSKILAEKLEEWSKIENDYAKKLASFKKSVTEDKVYYPAYIIFSIDFLKLRDQH